MRTRGERRKEIGTDVILRLNWFAHAETSALVVVLQDGKSQ